MQQNVNLNNIVLLYDCNTPRSFWSLARAIKVHPSKDELVRCVTLKLPNTTLVRPINKLYLLEESIWIHLNELLLGVEECCVYWYCKRRENIHVKLIFVSLSTMIFVTFDGIYLHFSRVFVIRLWVVAAKVMSCSQRKSFHFQW